MSRTEHGLAACTLKTTEGNRQDRYRDGTQSTGRCAAPGKLRYGVQLLLQYYQAGYSIRALADVFSCSRSAIYYHLRRQGHH